MKRSIFKLLKIFVDDIHTLYLRISVNRFRAKNKREIDKLFERPSPLGDEGWEFSTSNKDIVFEVGNISLLRLFRNPHKNTYCIQRGVAKKLLELLGCSYIPRRMQTMLRKVDSFSAVNNFLLYLRFNIKETLLSDERKNKLNSYIQILMEADEICKRIKVSDLPIYQALSTGDTLKAENMVDLLHKARRIYDGIHETEIIFPGYQVEFIAPALEKIDYWETLDEEILNELHDTLLVWRELQDIYTEKTTTIANLIDRIEKVTIKDKDTKSAFLQIVRVASSICKDIESGSCEVADGIDKLQELYDHLIIIYKSVEDNSGYGDDSYESSETPSSRDNRKMEDCISVLGLEGIGEIKLDQLKHTYRKLISIHHPDRNPDNPDAHNNVQRINHAYSYLNDKLGNGVNIYA